MNKRDALYELHYLILKGLETRGAVKSSQTSAVLVY